MNLECGRCGETFDSASGFTGIHSAVGETKWERLASGRVTYLCEACTGKLHDWLDQADDLRSVR